jgi:hypothetical protein
VFPTITSYSPPPPILAIFFDPAPSACLLASASSPPADREAPPQTRGSLEHPRRPAGRLPRYARAPYSGRPSHGRLAQRRSQAGQWQGGADLLPSSPWPIGTSNAGDGEAPPRARPTGGVGRSEDCCAARLAAIFTRCCCMPPWGGATGDFLDNILELPPLAMSATSYCSRPFRVATGSLPSKPGEASSSDSWQNMVAVVDCNCTVHNFSSLLSLFLDNSLVTGFVLFFPGCEPC